MGGLLDGYPRGPPTTRWSTRTACRTRTRGRCTTRCRLLTGEDLAERGAARDRSFRDQGITFSPSGEERPFPLDLVPRLIPAAEWEHDRGRRGPAGAGARGVPRRRLRRGRGPRTTASCRARWSSRRTHFHRGRAGIDPPNGVRVHVAGIDLVRDADGVLRVLEDNLRVAVGHLLRRREPAGDDPGVPRAVRRASGSGRSTDYPATAARGRCGAPAPARASTTRPSSCSRPGVHNSAYFEHSFLARQMGVELVEGRDLVCRDNVVYMRTTEGEQRVDVVYRRVDDDFLDPVQFRPDSVLGCPGIVNAARAGNVTIANAVGNGVADDKLIYPYVPELIGTTSARSRCSPTCTTYRLDDPDELARSASTGSTSWCSSRSTAPAGTAS